MNLQIVARLVFSMEVELCMTLCFESSGVLGVPVSEMFGEEWNYASLILFRCMKMM